MENLQSETTRGSELPECRSQGRAPSHSEKTDFCKANFCSNLERDPWRVPWFLFLHLGHMSIYIYFHHPVCLESPVDICIFFPVVKNSFRTRKLAQSVKALAAEV